MRFFERAELSAEAYCQVIKICLSAPEIKGILIIITPQFLSDPTAVARAITSAVSVSTTPVIAVWMGGEGMDTARQLLDEAGIPAYDAPERAIRAFLHLYEYDHNLRLLQETQIYTILRAHGSLQPDCWSALEELLVHFSHLITDFPEISEIEINPLLVVGERVFASNARSIIQTAKTPSPMHLIISAYPDEYETATVTKAGLSIFIRPIKPEDASLLQDLWSTLSQRTIYYRFSRPIKELTPELLIRFTQIDYDREIALIALQTAGTRDRMLGVARLIRQPGTNAAEFAVVVGDPWQGLGVGAKLLSCLAAIAIKQKIRTLWDLVLRENRAIIELCKKLGWTMELADDPSQVFLRLDLSSVDAPEILEAFGKNL